MRMTKRENEASDEIVVDSVDQPPARRRRGGSRPGRTFQKIKRAADDPIMATNLSLLKSEREDLARLGGGNIVDGVRKGLKLLRMLDERR